MKRFTLFHDCCKVTLVWALLAFAQRPHSTLAQGSLEPSGPPAPSMRTLDELEARIPVDVLHTPGLTNTLSLFDITQPGSYYLTGDIAGVSNRHGITIQADHVSLDLNGFTVQGVAGSRSGIRILGAHTNLTVQNGIVSGWGGLGLDGTGAYGGRYERLQIVDNIFSGLSTGPGCLVLHCVLSRNRIGLEASGGCLAQSCVAQGNSLAGFVVVSGSTLRGCSARSNGDFGIVTAFGALIRDCFVEAGTGDGILAQLGTVVTGCTVTDMGGNGIVAGGDSRLKGNLCQDNRGAGIYVSGGSDNIIEHNTLSGNGRGLLVETDGNLVAANSAFLNKTNYVMVANNKVGPIANVPKSGAINGSSGGAGVGTADPFANLSY